MNDVLGCDDVTCAAEIGGAVGTRYLLTGSVRSGVDTIWVVLNLIDTRDMKISRGSGNARNAEGMYETAIERAVRRQRGGRMPFRIHGARERRPADMIGFRCAGDASAAGT